MSQSSYMNRITDLSPIPSRWGGMLINALLVLLIVILVMGLIFLLAYRVENVAPDYLSLQGLNQETLIQWHANESVSISASAMDDAYLALGFAHARKAPWLMSLYLQTASGNLASWFGNKLSDLDIMALQLRLAEDAQQIFPHLPAETRRHLQAYAAGVNAAWSSHNLLSLDEFVLTGVAFPKWEPWHPIAIERLIAWMGTSPALSNSDLDISGAIFKARALQENWLRLSGFEESMLWVLNEEPQIALATYNYGNSILPLFINSSLQLDRVSIKGLTIPGLPVFFSGRTDERSWHYLISSESAYIKVPISDRPRTEHFRRQIDKDANEVVQRFEATDSLITGEHVPGQDTVWALSWAGLKHATDLPALMQIPFSDSVTLHLFNGPSVVQQDSGMYAINNALAPFENNGTLTVVGQSAWLEWVAHRLEYLYSQPVPVTTRELLGDCYSDWAANYVPDFIEIIGPSIQAGTPGHDAMAYLSNWDFMFDGASIGAALFSTWMDFAEAHTPDPYMQLPTDPLAQKEWLLTSFEAAIAHFQNTLGSNISGWRLEAIRILEYDYPAWQMDSLFMSPDRMLSRTRYASRSIPGFGHPSTICGRTRRIDMGSISTWTTWVHPDEQNVVHSIANNLLDERIVERYSRSNETDKYTILADSSSSYTTTRLIPIP